MIEGLYGGLGYKNVNAPFNRIGRNVVMSIVRSEDDCSVSGLQLIDGGLISLRVDFSFLWEGRETGIGRDPVCTGTGFLIRATGLTKYPCLYKLDRSLSPDAAEWLEIWTR